jgi:uncharacterized coiled-coil DUF342 family protein
MWNWPVPDRRIDEIIDLVRTVRDELHTTNRRIQTMSDTISAELAAERASLDNLRTAVGVAVSKIVDLSGQVASLANGAGTPEELATMKAAAAEIQAEADALTAAVTPIPVPPAA